MNDYTALKMTQLRREQAARLQRSAELEAELERPARRPLLPSFRLRIGSLLPCPLRPTLRLPVNRAAVPATVIPCESIGL